ncbi:hypothetical protein [Bacillus sp. JCM 19034]|uniref:hypothetical protein n=1 Tax=Bacillus sp. JCM 19034 TaxID=1481928 RepID=UPI000784B0FD|nr:hypothetical protein [Bacillus sp. JCM 19034]
MKVSKNDLITSYNNKAFERDSLIIPEWKLKERETFLTYMKKEDYNRLLEIGSGPGHDSLYFRQQGLVRDSYSPKRFFSFYEDETIKQLLTQFFQIEYFYIVPKEKVGGKFHFQSIILRKN